MAITTRALAFASRWFDEATVARVFEPLIADWQREWQDASPGRRARVSIRGLAAFICAVIVSSPSLLRTDGPSSVTNRVAVRMARFIALASILLMSPYLASAPESGWRAIILFSLVPSVITVAFPFSMIGAVDAIRRDDTLPSHVERALAAKLGVIALLFMIVFGGFVVQAGNQMFRAAVTRGTPPVRGVRELTTIELMRDPSIAHAGETTNAGGRAAVIRRELSNRAHLAILPVMLLWLRWGMLDRPRRRWYSPLPSWLMTPLVIAMFFLLNFIGINFARSAAVSAAVGVWLPALGFLAIGLITRWWSRAPLIEQGC